MASNPQEWWASLTPITQLWLAASVISSIGGRFNLFRFDVLFLDWSKIWAMPPQVRTPPLLSEQRI